LVGGLAGLVEELIDGGLEIVEIDLVLGEPLLQSDEGWIDEKFTGYNVIPRLSSRKVLHQTDGCLWLVFSAPRSIPAFPTPLRRVIGHHWPWYRLPGPMAFMQPDGAVGSDLGRR
jgi:hypothetical protein